MLKLRKLSAFLLVATLFPVNLMGCATIAQWAAPAKKAADSAPPEFLEAEKDFWTQFHAAKYDQVPRLLEKYNGMYVLHPNHPVIAARIGFLHVWRLAERMRIGEVRASIIDDATLCHKFFAEASRLDPKEARFKGFHAACIMAEADIHQDEASTRKGYFLMKDAISDWPEFNLFTGGFVMSHLPWEGSLFDEALAWQWKTLDLCSGKKVDRKNPEYPQYDKQDFSGPKRVCGNSSIAPHNFEGFFLNMGDMLVKKGEIATAKKVYGFARLSPTYNQWPYKKMLEDRMQKAEENVKFFRVQQRKEVLPTGPHLMFHSEAACMACHRAT